MPNETVKELTEKLENGVRELFASDKYAEYFNRNSCTCQLLPPAAT